MIEHQSQFTLNARIIFAPRHSCRSGTGISLGCLALSSSGQDTRVKREGEKERERGRKRTKRGWHSVALVPGVPADVSSTWNACTSDVRRPMYIIYEVSAFSARINQVATPAESAGISDDRWFAHRSYANIAGNVGYEDDYVNPVI